MFSDTGSAAAPYYRTPRSFLIADFHEVIRKSLTCLIERRLNQVVAEAASAAGGSEPQQRQDRHGESETSA